MTIEDLDRVLEIERGAFLRPWKMEHFLFELRENRWAVNRIAEQHDTLLGYASTWQLHGELKINNVATHPDVRRRGVARWMLGCVIAEATGDGCRVATLEVRESNVAARQLYARLGFRELGRRPRYYQAEGEDAILLEATLDKHWARRIATDSERGV